MPLRDFRKVIPAGETDFIAFDGDAFACVSSNLPSFGIRTDGKPLTDFQFGWEYAPPEGYKRLEISNPNAVALDVTFKCWTGKFVDRRLISNQPQGFAPVTLADLNGTGFFGGTTAIGAAASVPFIRFYNPAGSGVTTVIRRLWIAMPNSGGFVTFIPTPPGFGPPSGTVAGNLASSFAAITTSQTEMRYGSTPQLGAVAGGGTRFVFNTDAAGRVRQIDLSTAIVLEEDAYLSIIGSNVGVPEILYMNAEILELPAG